MFQLQKYLAFSAPFLTVVPPPTSTLHISRSLSSLISLPLRIPVRSILTAIKCRTETDDWLLRLENRSWKEGKGS
jgi:hypothetical protein